VIVNIEPPVSNCPKCQAYVHAHGRWFLKRAGTILGHNFASLIYGYCRDLPHVLNALFMWRFREKFGISHWEISISCTTQEGDNVITPYYPISALLSFKWSLMEVKKKGKCQTFSHGCLQEFQNVVIWLGNFWYFGKLVAEERWSLMRGDCNWRFDCILWNACDLITNWYTNCYGLSMITQTL